MDRRTVCGLLAATPLGALAQAPGPQRVAWASSERANPDAPSLVNFRRGLRELGRVEGRDVAIDYWWGEGTSEGMKQLVPKVVASNPRVVIAPGGPSVYPFVEAGVKLPIVFTVSSDPVVGKLVADWGRPGVERTGIAFYGTKLIRKRLGFLLEMKPGIRRLGVVGWSRHAGEEGEVRATLRVAGEMGLAHQYHPVDSVADLDAAFAELARWRVDAVLAFADAISATHAARFAAFGESQRVPCVSAWAVFAQRGNLMTFGPNLEQSYARLAYFVDLILKGKRASDLAVQEPPGNPELVINRRTANLLGLTITPALLAQANQILD